MKSRRKFLKSMAYAGAGGYMMGNVPLAAAQSGRREISIGGLRTTVVDMHAHCEIKEVEKLTKGTSLDVSVNNARVMGPKRIADMDMRGIDISALHVGNYWWFDADATLSERLTRLMNEGMADWVSKNSERFVALATVSLQHPELAAEELEYAVRKLGHRGASIGGHVGGESPTSPRFDPFWAKADELNVPVMMHPANAGYFVDEEKFAGRGYLANVIGNPLETTMFLSRMMFDGVFDRHPGLKVVTVHGGGYLPSYSGRSEVACERGGADCLNKKNPREYLRSQIFVDSLVFNEETLRHLVDVMGVTQVGYGTDSPYPWPDTLDLILNASGLSDAEKVAMVGGNAKRLLHID